MATELVTNTLQVTIISQEDTTQNVPINRSADAQMDAGLGKYSYAYVGTVPIGLDPSISISRFLQLYVRNLSSGDAVIGIYKEVAGGAFRLMAVVAPGDIFVYWGQNKTSTPMTGDSDGDQPAGFVDVQLKASADKTPVEYFIGGV